VDDLEHDLVPVLEALELRQPHLERHLAALESGRDVLPGLGALGTATGGLALGRLATTHAGLLGVRPGRGPQVVQLDAHVVTSVSSTTTRWLTTLRRPRVCALSSRKTDFRMPLSPSVRRQSRWFFFDPMVPRTWVIFRFARIYAPCPARARSIPAGATSSIGRPRRAATSSGRCRPLSAATVACTTLMALSDPSDLHRMSLTPAHSSTARAAPPAITPVPGEAGRRSTTPAASSPWIECGMVEAMSGTRKKFFRASSDPFWIADRTSLALP